ncbi:MAG: TetR family transcriptional regulator [Acidimicrobiia bacterium]|nr:TetR family transcriptional regulator [Acidimicrobiia bacterium]
MEPSARQAILDAAVELVHERGVATGVTHVKVAAAARRAGYSSGAAYRHWATQDDFHRELAVAVLRWRDRSSFADLIASVRSLVESHAPLLEVIRVGATANLDRLPDETDYFVTLALRASAMFSADVVAAARERVDEGLEEHAQVYDVLMQLSNRRPRPPFTRLHLAAALAALADGFAVQDVGGEPVHVDRPGLGEGIGRDWTLFGVAVEAMVEHLTEPCDGEGRPTAH